MALFGSKKNTEKKAVKAPKAAKVEKAVAEKVVTENAPLKEVILRPRITEKSGMAGESLNIYTFEVTQNATKHTIARAIKAQYKVTPLKVRTVSLPAKRVLSKGRWGYQSAVKKAMVFLKKGDKIEIA